MSKCGKSDQKNMVLPSLELCDLRCTFQLIFLSDNNMPASQEVWTVYTNN